MDKKRKDYRIVEIDKKRESKKRLSRFDGYKQQWRKAKRGRREEEKQQATRPRFEFKSIKMTINLKSKNKIQLKKNPNDWNEIKRKESE